MSQPARPQYVDSTDTIAMIIEIVFGLFFVMGVGWLYVGNVAVFVTVLLGYWLLVGIEVTLTIFSFGCLACLFYPLNIVLVIVSGVRARDYVRQTKAKGSAINVLAVVVILILGLCLAWLIFVMVLGETASSLNIPTPHPWPTLAPLR